MPKAVTWEGRRALIDNPSASPEAFRLAGRELLELDQLAEALELLGRAGDEEGLAAILERAAAEGHFFLFQAAAAKLGGPWRSHLEKLADMAEKNGQTLYAEQARAALAESG